MTLCLRFNSKGHRYCKIHGFQSLDQYYICWYEKRSAYNYTCKKCHAESKRNWKLVSGYDKKYHVSLRLEVLGHYSQGKLVCVICGEDHIEFLVIDHIKGDGAEHRRSVGSSPSTIYRDLISNGFPDGFRVLCHNCNLKYGCRDFYRGPSKKPDSKLSQTEGAIAQRRYRARHQDQANERRADSKDHYYRIKAEVMAHYGGKCVCCGVDDLKVLSIDHIGGGGRAHVSELKAQGKSFGYYWLRAQGFPPGFQVLCMNCNQSKGANEICIHERDRMTAVQVQDRDSVLESKPKRAYQLDLLGRLPSNSP